MTHTPTAHRSHTRRAVATATKAAAFAALIAAAVAYAALTGTHTASTPADNPCTGTAPTTACLTGLKPIDRTAAFFPLAQRYTVRVIGDHGVQRVPVTLY